MEKIPKVVLENIHRRMFIFLWIGSIMKEGIHLVKWSRLAKPENKG